MLNNQEPSTPVLLQNLGYIYPNENSKYKAKYGLYRCECGNEYRTQQAAVRRGTSKSCGCWNVRSHTTHGYEQHRLYSTWHKMIHRTTNQKSNSYQWYGAHGIKVCDRWQDVALFIEDMYPSHKEGLTIDRIDSSKDYSPDNCRWSTKTVQSRNTKLINTKNTSGYRGVSMSSDRKKWRANITVHSKLKHIGMFLTAIEAAQAYDKYIQDNNLEHTQNFPTKI